MENGREGSFSINSLRYPQLLGPEGLGLNEYVSTYAFACSGIDLDSNVNAYYGRVSCACRISIVLALTGGSEGCFNGSIKSHRYTTGSRSFVEILRSMRQKPQL